MQSIAEFYLQNSWGMTRDMWTGEKMVGNDFTSTSQLYSDFLLVSRK